MWKYVGNGEFLWGVPARDLTEEEAALIGYKMLRESGLYQQDLPKEDKSLKPSMENKERK